MTKAEEILDRLEKNHPSHDPKWKGSKSYGRDFVLGAINEALNIPDVSQQGELLKAFAVWLQIKMWNGGDKDFDELVNEFLSL